MSMQLSRMQPVALKKRKQVLRDDQSGYENVFTALQATVQPLTGHTNALMYGERLNKTKLMLTTPGVLIEEGMGVCVDVPVDAEPDYRVVYTAGWAKHTVAHIQYIPEEERAAQDEA